MRRDRAGGAWRISPATSSTPTPDAHMNNRCLRSTASCDVASDICRALYAGCYVCMDEVLVFETTAFEIFCEKERWAGGSLRTKQAQALEPI